jgi:hypothetical protein
LSDTKPKTMKYYTLNWINYSKFSKRLGPFNTLEEALNWADHKTPNGAESQSWEEYSEVIECDEKDNVTNRYYFVSEI